MRPIALMLILMPLSATALAQQADDGQAHRKVKYAERTEIDFDLRDITAEVVKPDVITIDEVQRKAHGPLFHLRRSFDEEVRASVDLIK